MDAPQEPRRTLAPALVLALVTFLVFARAHDFEFVTLDDEAYVVTNEHVRGGLSLAGLRWALTAWHANNWHPLTWLSHMLDCELFGLDAGAHHLVSAALHAANAALAFAALRALTGAGGPSLAAAALFALHPLRAESVAWVAERKDVLSGLFFFLTLCAWARYARRPSAGRMGLVAASLALGLAAKPMLVTLPVVLLVLDVWPLGRWRAAGGGARALRRLTLEKAPLFALALAAGLVTLAVQSGTGAVRSLDALGVADRAATALEACADYLRTTVWPAGLACFYPNRLLLHPDAPPWRPQTFAALALVALSSFAALRARRTQPWLLVGWLWFLVMLLPVIGLVQVGEHARADRYTYLPSVGLSIAVAFGLAHAAPRAGPWLAGAALVVLVPLTWRQVGTWRSSFTLFEHALAVTDENYLAEQDLGLAHLRRGELEAAGRRFAAALAIRPAYFDAHMNLGVVEGRSGRLSEALEHFRAATRLRPDSADAWFNAGYTLARAGDALAAVDALERALERAPASPAVRVELARALERAAAEEEARGDGPAAARLRARARALAPGAAAEGRRP